MYKTEFNYRNSQDRTIALAKPLYRDAASDSFSETLPSELIKMARPIIKSGKKLAIEQLTLARKFLRNPRNKEIASVISELFFGVRDLESIHDKWLRSIDKVLDGIDGLDTKKHINYLPLKITPLGEKSTTTAEINVNAYADKKEKYMRVYVKPLIEVSKKPSLGNDHVAHIVIHEMSHACLNTNDSAYIGVMSNDGFHDLTELVNLINPNTITGSGKHERDESNKQRLARGRASAWNNADSFTTSVRYLAYAAKKIEFFQHVSQQKDLFKNEGRFLIQNPHWTDM